MKKLPLLFLAAVLGLCSAVSHAQQKKECDKGAGAMSCSSSCVQYKCSPQGRWVVDKEGTERENRLVRDIEDRRERLWSALRTRVVTDKEMEEILAYGESINIQPMVSYRPEDASRERLDAFEMQLILRKMEALKHCHTKEQQGQ